MENFNEGANNQNDLGLDSTAQAHLLVTRKWSMFLSIMGLLMCGLMIIAVVAFMAFNTMASVMPFGSTMFLPYALVLVCYIFPFYYLFQFSKYAKEAILQRDSALLTLAMFNLKRHYRFLGILVILILVLYVFLFFFMVYFLGEGF